MENKKTPKLSELQKNWTNPFILDLQGRMFLQPKPNTVIAKGEQIVDTTTGEVIKDTVLIGRRKVVDRTEFAKLYFTELKTIYELSRCAYNVLMYIAKRMDFENKVILSAESEYQTLGYKQALPVRNGLRELASKGIIAGGPIPSMYWVNPIFICKGERFAMYTEYVTEDLDSQQIEGQLKAQAADRYNALDEHTQHSLDAMNQRAELAYHSSDPERYEREFPGMSGEKAPRFVGNTQTGEFEVQD